MSSIMLVHDKEGFLYPQVDVTKCVDCHLCEKVCPLSKRKDRDDYTIENQHFYAARHNDNEVLMQSSSGGAFSAFARVVLNQDGVVFGATYDSNMKVCHVAIDKEEDLWKLRGSKYVQSDIRGVFHEIKAYLNSGRYVLFSGTPCQVDGLRHFLRKDEDHLFTIDLVCHAAGSPALFHDYIKYLERKYKKRVVWMNMRDKTKQGWSHHFIQSVYFESGKKVYQNDNMITWWSIYYSHMTNRPSCHECKYANYERPGDITLADFWDDNKTRTDVYSKDGTSLCVVNSKKGNDFFEKAKKKLLIWEVAKEESWQPCLESPTPQSPNRTAFWQCYSQNGSVDAFKKYCYTPFLIRYKWIIKDYIAKLIGYAPKN